MKMSPQRKSGIDIAMPLIPSIIPSIFVSRSRVPKRDNVPPSIHAINKASKDNSRVAGNRPRTKDKTGCLREIEVPKSPLKTPLIQIKNCSIIDLSKP